MKKQMTITFNFTEEQDEFDPEYTFLEYENLEVGGNLTKGELAGMAEGWAQSDHFWVDICSEIISEMSKSSK